MAGFTPAPSPAPGGGGGILDPIPLTGAGVVPTFADTVLTETFGQPLSEFAEESTMDISGPAVLKASNEGCDRIGYPVPDSHGKKAAGLWLQIAFDQQSVGFLGVVVVTSDGELVAGIGLNTPGYWGGLLAGDLAFGQNTGPVTSNRAFLKFTDEMVIEAGDMQLVPFGISAVDITMSAQFQPYDDQNTLIRDLLDIAGVSDPTTSQGGLLMGLLSLGDFMKSFEGRFDNDRAVDRFVAPLDSGVFDTLTGGPVDPGDQPLDTDGNQCQNGDAIGLLSEGTNDNGGAWAVRIMSDDEADPGKWVVVTDDSSILPNSRWWSTNALTGGTILRAPGKLAVFRSYTNADGPDAGKLSVNQQPFSVRNVPSGEWLVVWGIPDPTGQPDGSTLQTLNGAPVWVAPG